MPRVEAPTKAVGVLAAHANAGISKKKANKKLSRSQRLRQQKGIERGEMLFDRLETKVEKAKASYSKVVTARKVCRRCQCDYEHICLALITGTMGGFEWQAGQGGEDSSANRRQRR